MKLRQLSKKYVRKTIEGGVTDLYIPKKYSSAILLDGYFEIRCPTHVNRHRHNEQNNDKQTLRNGGRTVKSLVRRRQWQHCLKNVVTALQTLLKSKCINILGLIALFLQFLNNNISQSSY